MRIAFFIPVFIFSLLLAPASGQVNLRGPASTGVGGGGAAMIDNLDAMHVNPATLSAGSRRGRISIGIGQLSAFAGGDLLQFKYYNTAFTSGNELTDEVATEIINDWFGDPSSGDLRSAEFGADAVPLAFAVQFGDWAIGSSVRSRTTTKIGVSGGWLDLILVGDEEQRDIPMNADIRLLSTTEFGVAFSKSFASGLVNIGVAPRYILGNEFSENVFESVATISADSIVHRFDYLSRAAGGLGTRVIDNLSFFSPSVLENESYSPSFLGGAGAGYGLDLGVVVKASPGIRIAASVTDIGSITWDQDAETARPANNEFRFDGLNLDLDRLDDEYNGDIVDYAQDVLDSLARGAYEEVIRETGSFTSKLPTAFHIGGRISATRKLMVVGGSSMSLNKEAGNVASQPSLHVGAEYLLGGAIGLPIRGGVHVGGSGAFAVAGGFGLRTPVYDFDIGFIVTPRTDIAGAGGRYAISLSLANIRI
ncbi:MAG: hypothetical protein HKN43_04175 [Rhodothermales bacterium]|nr:hypothetical protein [Rhodothermales bacterium]